MILGSRLMLSGWSIGRKIRSPIDLAIGWMRAIQCTTNMGFRSDRLRTIGHAVFFPPNVKGWDGGRTWINSSTLVGRANLIYELVNHENTRFDGSKLHGFLDRNKIKEPSQLSALFAKLFLIEDLSEPERGQLLRSIDASKPDRWASQVLVHMASLPRIHLS